MSEHRMQSMMEKGIPQRKAASLDMMGASVEKNSPARVKPNRTGRKVISKKIEKLIKEEDKTPEQAAGQAFGMARQGSLGSAAKRAAGRRRKKQ